LWTRRPRVALTPRAEEMLGPGRRLCQGETRAGPGQGGLVTHVGPVWTICVEMWRNRWRQRHKCAWFGGEPAVIDHTMLTRQDQTCRPPSSSPPSTSDRPAQSALIRWRSRQHSAAAGSALLMAVSTIQLACNALTEPPASLCLCSTATLPALSSTRTAYASTWSQALLLRCRSETPTAECTQSSISHPLSRHHLAPTLRDVWSSACFLSECGR